MATPQAIQIREVTARQAMDASLARIAGALGVTLPEPNREWSHDPRYRSMVELENLAAAVAVIAEAVAPVAVPDQVAAQADEPEQDDAEAQVTEAESPDFASMTAGELRRLASDIGLEVKGLNKPQLIDALKAVAGE